MRKSKNKDTVAVKRETVEEFLARGGKVTQLPPAPTPDEDTNRVGSNSNATSTMMSLSEGALFYSESRAKPKERKIKVVEAINTAALPLHLLKYMPKRNEE